MLLLETEVHALFILLLLFAAFLVGNLLVQFFADQSAAFGFAEEALFLLLVVQQLVELLNCSPLVFLSDLAVHLSQRSLTACLRNCVGLTAHRPVRSVAGAHRLRIHQSRLPRADLRRGSRAATFVALAVVEDLFTLISELGFIHNLGVKVA